MTVLRCIVFDVDDTLYLERDYVASGFRAVGAHVARVFHKSGFSALALAEFLAGRRGDIFDHVCRLLGLPESVVPELVRVYRTHLPEISLSTEGASMLEGLSGRCRLAVITDGPLESQRAKVTALGLARYCSPVICTAIYGRGYSKPHPRAYVAVEELTGVRGAACAYVGDNPSKDFVVPHERGWLCVRLRAVGSLHEAIPSGPDVAFECRNLAELSRVLG